MTNSPQPPCPRCARTDGALVSSRIIYRAADTAKEHPVARMLVVKCQCGLGFTHDEPIGPSQDEAQPGAVAKAWFLKPESGI